MQTMSEQKAKAQDWAGLILGAEDLSDQQPPTLYLGLERGRDPAAPEQHFGQVEVESLASLLKTISRSLLHVAWAAELCQMRKGKS